MKPSQIRDELLSQHQGLRRHLDAARLVADRWARGEATRDEVRDELGILAEALLQHNAREEKALRDLIRTVDAWGPAREEIMDESHVREHRDLHDAIVRTSMANEPGATGRDLEKFCARLLDHMSHEEKGFLNATVLRDDDVCIDVEGG